MAIEVNLSAGFNVTNFNVALGNEAPDATPVWTFPGDTPTNRILSDDQSLRIDAQWTVQGPVAALMGNCKYLCRVFLEQMGAGEAFPGNYQTLVNHVPVVGPVNYTAHVTIPPIPAGVYRIVFTLTMLGPSNNHLPVAGFVDLGFLQVFSD